MRAPACQAPDHADVGRARRATPSSVRSVADPRTHPGRMTTAPSVSARRIMLNKVPEVTVYFWIIKILCTTVGESFADYINETLGFGLTKTTLLFSAGLIIALVAQFRLNRYVPGVYWLSVVLISVVGTLLTDNLTDGHGVPLWISSTVFAVLLAAVFSIWYAREHTLSIHTIVTTPREAFYWLTRARHLRPRYGGRRLDPRAHRLAPGQVRAPAAGADPGRAGRLEAGHGAGALVLARLHPDPPARRQHRRLPRLPARRRRPRPRHPGHQRACSWARSWRSWST